MKGYNNRDTLLETVKRGKKELRIIIDLDLEGKIDLDKIVDAVNIETIDKDFIEIDIRSKIRYTYENLDKIPSYLTVFDMNELEMDGVIGYGLSGEIEKTKDNKVAKIADDDYHVKILEREIGFLSKLEEIKGVIKISGLIKKENTIIGILIPYMRNGNLTNYIKKNKVGKEQKLKWIREICSILLNINEMGINHCDIKGTNVVLDENLEPHVIDFGSAMEISSKLEPKTTIHYSPPEIEVHETYDTYMLGSLIWEIFSEQIPYIGLRVIDIDKKVSKPDLSNIPEEIVEIIKECWKEKNERKKIKEIIQSFDILK